MDQNSFTAYDVRVRSQPTKNMFSFRKTQTKHSFSFFKEPPSFSWVTAYTQNVSRVGIVRSIWVTDLLRWRAKKSAVSDVESQIYLNCFTLVALVYEIVNYP